MNSSIEEQNPQSIKLQRIESEVYSEGKNIVKNEIDIKEYNDNSEKKIFRLERKLKETNRIIQNEEPKEITERINLSLSSLLGVKNIRNILGISENEGILIPLIRKFIYKLKKNTLFFKYKQMNDKNLSMIKDVLLTQTKNERKYDKEILGKSTSFSHFEMKIIGFLSSIPIVNPHDNLKICWDIIHFFLTIFLLFWIPIDVCFQVNMPSLFSICVSTFFMSDIFLNLNTAYFQKGFIVVKRKKILSNYFKNFFLLDIITAIIYIVDLFADNSGLNNLELTKLFLFVRLGSLSLIYDKLLEKFKIRLKVHNSFIDLINLLFYSLLIIHIFACFWNYVGEINLDAANIVTWLEYNGIIQENFLTRYVFSLYWSAVTIMTVGYGDISAHNKEEHIYSIITILVGCGVFAYIINTIGIIIGDIRKENILFKQNLNIITNYMERKKVDYNLQMKIREYLRFIWKEEFTQNAEMEQLIINKLSKSLKEELFLEANGKILNKYPLFFANFSENFLRQLMYKMKEVRHTPEDLIFSEGASDEGEIFFILKGMVQLFIPDNKNSQDSIILKNLKEGDSFGEISFFTGSPRSASALCKDYTTLCLIKREDFFEILHKNPEDFEKFRMIYDQIKLEKNYNGLSIKCFSCDQKGHLSHNCPLIHYIPDPEKICRVYEFNPGQKNRREIIRNPAKASNALSSKNETISAYQKFQKVLKELYEDLDNNDSFAQNSDKDSNSSRGSDEDLKEVSPIEMKNSTKSNFNISALKTNNSQKFNPRITLKKVGNDNEKDNENLIENVREPENNYQTDNEMKDINEIFFESNGVERLKNNENRKTDESLKTIEIPSIKKFNDLIINTGISKSACIKINQEKKRHELKMKEFPELNSLNSNSLPENQQIKDGNKIIRSISPEKEDKNEFQFMEPNKNNNFSMSFEMQQLELNENFLIDQKFDDEISKTKKQDNFFDIPHQTSDDLIHFNPQIKTQLFSFELLEGFLPKPIKKMPEFERNEEENNNKIIISPNAVKSTRNKSIFRTKNNIQIKKKSTELTPTTTPTPKVLKKKKSFLDFAKSPLLKLPIFNFESPMIQKTKTLDSSKIQVSEKNKNIETETMAQLSHNTMDIQKNDENFLENLEIDKVANFKNYYPENNIKNIINRMVKAKKKLSLENVRRNPKKHHLTRHFKQYFNKIDMENLSKTNFKSNKIIPKTPSSLNVTPLKKLSENSPQKNSLTPSQNKRPSNIFTTNHNKKNFFQHSFNEITFYDVVYEVMTNKELRKDLLIEKMESKKKKSNNRMKKK